MDKFKFLSKNKIAGLPKTSGVYCFVSQKPKAKADFKNGKELIYIGKAINIRDRVKNHFQGKNWWEKTLLRQGFGGQVGYFETNSEIEALILEADLIKKYQPKYNVMWRDDKNYFYVAVAKNENKIPYVFITHQPKLQTTHYKLQTQYIGPFTEGTALKKTLRFLRRAFPYYSVKKHSKIKCTYCHLDLCPGPVPDLIEYKKNIKKLILILKGKRTAVLKSLKREMKQLSKDKEFEKAGKTRDKIHALQQIIEHTRVINSEATGCPTPHQFGGVSDTPPTLKKIVGIKKDIQRIECYDVSNIQGKQATGSMVVFINGEPDKNQYRKFRIKIKNEPNDIAMLKEVLQRRLAHAEWEYPDLILIDGGKAQLNVAINSKKQANIKILSVAKKNKELFIEEKEKPILLKSLPREIYNLILQLDAEAHRFAITYHKKLRKKNLMP